MKRYFLLFISFIICICFSSCVSDKEESYDFLHSSAEINTIEIVRITYFDKDDSQYYIDGPSIEILTTVDEQNVFLKDFSLIKSYKRGYPHAAEGISVSENVIKILYQNGEYELIGPKGQGYYTYSENNVNGWGYHNYGIYYFDITEFHYLIETYTDVTIE